MMVSVVFFYLSKLLFSGFFNKKVIFVRGQNKSSAICNASSHARSHVCNHASSHACGHARGHAVHVKIA